MHKTDLSDHSTGPTGGVSDYTLTNTVYSSTNQIASQKKTMQDVVNDKPPEFGSQVIPAHDHKL